MWGMLRQIRAAITRADDSFSKCTHARRIYSLQHRTEGTVSGTAIPTTGTPAGGQHKAAVPPASHDRAPPRAGLRRQAQPARMA